MDKYVFKKYPTSCKIYCIDTINTNRPSSNNGCNIYATVKVNQR